MPGIISALGESDGRLGFAQSRLGKLAETKSQILEIPIQQVPSDHTARHRLYRFVHILLHHHSHSCSLHPIFLIHLPNHLETHLLHLSPGYSGPMFLPVLH